MDDMNSPLPIAGDSSHPPLLRGTLPMFKPRTAWPVVIGVVAAVFGASGALGGLANVIMPLFFGAIPRPGPGQPDPFTAMIDWKAWLIGLGVVTTLLGALLLLGAIVLLNRHAAARLILLVWAVLKMMLVVASAVIGYHMNQAQLAAMMQSGGAGSPMSGFGGIMQAMGVAGAVISVLWGWALPVFLIIWFLRPRITREVASWRGPAQQFLNP